MLKVTYTGTGLYLEYCPTPLDLLLSDRVCLYARAQRAIAVQPMQASIPLPTALVAVQGFDRFPEVELSICDRDWTDVTLCGLWISENSEEEDGLFVTELNPRLEQRLFRVWQLAQTTSHQMAVASRPA